MEGVNGQLQTKYQKIAAEYSKIRAQANVLKKAVIEEQARNTDIRNHLKEREVELRRADQEIDSLTFRNQQLTKRITVLQEELDKAQNKSKKSKSKVPENNSHISPTPPNNILDEEFQKKIVENAQLLSQISDKDSEIESLYERIQQLEYKVDYSEKSKIESECQYQSTIDKLERERNDLQRKLNDRQKQEETVSWSSNEGRRDGYDFDAKGILSNHRQTEPSPFSSPSASRRSSKSLGEGKPQKPQEESNVFLYTKSCDLEKEINHWKTQYHILKIKHDELEQKKVETISQIDNDIVKPVEINNMNEVMQVQLETSESKREKCETALLETLSNYNSLQKEKEMQEGNYKIQLNTMSEHLANMNEKLICQTEEIQQLKFELANKNSKKGKQK
ncbi:hypothetical protein ACFW04_001909 [Cataglyphis niger]